MLTQADMLQCAKEISGQVAHINSLRKAANVLVSKVVDLSNTDAGQVRNFIKDWHEDTAYKRVNSSDMRTKFIASVWAWRRHQSISQAMSAALLNWQSLSS